MKEKHTPKKPRLPHLARGILVYCASIVFIVGAIFGTFSVVFAGEIYPRVSVGGVMLGGLKPEAAKTKLEQEFKNLPLKPVILTDNAGASITIKPVDVDANYSIDESVAQAMAVGRGKDALFALTQKLTTPIFGLDLPAKITIADDKFGTIQNQIIDKVNVEEKNANLSIKDGVVSVIAAHDGKSVETANLKNQVLSAFGLNETDPITLKIRKKEPTLKDAAVAPAKKIIETILSDSIILTYQDQKFTATPTIIGSWILTSVTTKIFQSKLEISFNEPKIADYIGSIAAKIDIEPLNARLAVVNKIVTITQSSKDGLIVKRDIAKAELLRLLRLRQEGVLPSPVASESIIPTDSSTPLPSPTPEIATNQITIETEVKKPDVTDSNINDLGIKERIAVSTTDFKGSPANRQENIRVGTRLFNGYILKPGDQFSSVKALGRIDESAGFKPELVIKEDMLIPEIGGGLCQVSTTLFRAVMNAGLQIDERRNHRFRVSYYEARPSVIDPEDYVTLNAKSLVGLDATIYDPSPDFKFKNDTASYILIQGHIEGTRITFELFGTKDGRTPKIDGPYITSTTPAPTEIVYIDDPTLPTGQTKLKENPHDGAKTSFTYSVTKDGQQIHKNIFTSNYVVWKAKYFRGTGPAVKPSPLPEATPAASPVPTPEVTPPAT